MTEKQQQKNNDEISFKELVLIIKDSILFLKTKLIFILLIGVVFCVIYTGYNFFTKKTLFNAKLIFLIEDNQTNNVAGGLLGLASQFGMGGGSTSNKGIFSNETLPDLMKTKLIIQKVLLKKTKIDNLETTLADYYIKINKDKFKKDDLRGIKFSKSPGFLSKNETLILRNIYSNLISEEYIKIGQDKKTPFKTIEILNEDQVFAKEFCESIIFETSNYYNEQKNEKQRSNIDLLQKRIDSIRDMLNSGLDEVAKASDQIFNLNPSLNIKKTNSAKKQFNVTSNTAILTTLISSLETIIVSSLKETPLFQIVELPEFPLNKESPNFLRMAILSFFIGSIFAIIYLLLYKYLKSIFN
jgi:LPS O-antigen subunit length determinant protein (WzzB/FepE family)